MKFSVSSTALASSVGLVSRVINKKNSLPILTNILFEVKDGTLKLTGSDSEVTMTTSVDITEQEGEGMFCVNAANMKDALSMLAEQPVIITAAPDDLMRLSIQHQSGDTYFPIELADEYPLPQSSEYHETLEGIPDKWLSDTLKRTLWALSTSELRPTMCGVNFKLEDGYLEIVGTNGHVVIRSRYSCGDKVDHMRIGSFIMPKKVANILSSILEGDTDIRWNDKEATIHLLQCDITFRLIEGKFPNYNSIFPQDQSQLKEVEVSRVSLMNSIGKVMPFAEASGGTKLLRLKLDNGELTIAGVNFDYNCGATDTIEVEYAGEMIGLGANGQYLHNIIKNLEGPELNLKITDKTHPFIVEPSSKVEGQEVSMLIMPMLLD